MPREVRTRKLQNLVEENVNEVMELNAAVSVSVNLSVLREHSRVIYVIKQPDTLLNLSIQCAYLQSLEGPAVD